MVQSTNKGRIARTTFLGIGMRMIRHFSSESREVTGAWAPVILVAALALLIAPLPGCTSSEATKPTASKKWRPPKQLAEWKIFKEENGKLVHQPLDGVVPYEMNSPLFSDYTAKYRFVKLPPGTKAKYDEAKVFDFPVGTVIAKTFSYPHDRRDLSKGEKILETRILTHRETGWEGFSYQWNEEQNGATLAIAGATVPSEWIHDDGTTKKIDYIIPDANKCISCHEEDKKVVPIGPKARHLNRDLGYPEGTENQLTHWSRIGILDSAPTDPSTAPKNAVWNDPSTGTLDERARAYLEINCAHCHHWGGPARNAGLDFRIAQDEGEKIGIWKSPAAVGRGGGGRKYSIVPGKPDASILYFRLNSDDPGIMMPEVARRMIHTEGVALIKEWIEQMPDRHSQEPPKKEAGGE
ncbi:hypothetical protein K2Y11_13460 [bacterium]|nr:hypothetical protein [bacterium]